MKAQMSYSRLAGTRILPFRVILTAVVVTLAAVGFGMLQQWPLWALVLVALIPWIPLFTAEMLWVFRQYQSLALFYVLVVTQTGHFLEHVVQMVQIHILGLKGADARGVFGALDIEWVHFIWNTWVAVALLILVSRFTNNRWLWLTFAISIWHQIEHSLMIWVYLTTGVSGSPGLLSKGGAIGGGLPILRPDMHFLYNLIETVPLIIAFVWQLRAIHAEEVRDSPARRALASSES